MPRPRSAMRQIREVLRLSLGEGLSPRQIRDSTGLGRATVQRYVTRARERGLRWPLPDDMDDRQLQELLFAREMPPPSEVRPAPNWVEVNREIRRPGVTLQLLWVEYKQRYPEGFQYTWFAQTYTRWRQHLDAVMRQ